MSTYPSNIINFIETVYNPEKDPENGPYIESTGLYGISKDYFVYYNAYEIGEFLVNNDRRCEFVLKYFHLDGNSDNQTIINNLQEYGQDLFTWWSVKKDVVNSLRSYDQCHKVYWLNSTKLNLTMLGNNRFYETYFNQLIIRATNGRFHTVGDFIMYYNTNVPDEDYEMIDQLFNFFLTKESTYYSIEEIEQILYRMLYNYSSASVQRSLKMGVWGQVDGLLKIYVYEPDVSENVEKNKKRFYDSSMIVNYLNHVLECYKNTLYYKDDPIKAIQQMKNEGVTYPWYNKEPFNYQNNTKCSISHCVSDTTPLYDGHFGYCVIPCNYESHISTAFQNSLFCAEDLDDLWQNKIVNTIRVSEYLIPFRIIDRHIFGEMLVDYVFDLIEYIKDTKDIDFDVSYNMMMINGSENLDHAVFYTDNKSYNNVKVEYHPHDDSIDDYPL